MMAGPWEKYQSSDAPPSPSDGKPWEKYQNPRVPYTEVESALMGAADSASLGFADEGVALYKTAKEALKDPKAAYKAGLSGLKSSYQEKVKGERENFTNAQSDNPNSYLAGEVGGSLVTAAIPAVGTAKTLGTLGKLGVAAGTSALQAAGASTADLTEGEFEKFGEDVGSGALTGLAVQGGMSVLGRTASGIADRFKSMPETRAVKAATGQSISSLRRIANISAKRPGDIRRNNAEIARVGRDILDEPGALGFFDNVEDLAPRLTDARMKYGAQIGEIGAKMDAVAPKSVSAKNIADKIVQYADKIPDTDAGEKIKDRLLSEAARQEKKGMIGFVEAQQLKNQFPFSPQAADALMSNQDATNAVQQIISREMRSAARRVGEATDDDLIKSYPEALRKFSSFIRAEDAATGRANQNLMNRFVSPSDYGVGLATGAAQAVAGGGINPASVVLGASASAANKQARERGSAFVARSADAILKTLDSDGIQGFMKAAKPVMDKVRQGNPSAIATWQIIKEMNPKAAEYLNQQNAMQRRASGE